MQDRAGKITYGAMMIAMFVILLGITIYIPLVALLTIFVIPLPIMLYRLRFDRSSSILVLVGGILVSMLIGGLLALPFAIAFGAIGLVIGDTMSTEKTKLYTFMASGLTMLITLMLTYVATVFLIEVNIIEQLMVALRESQEQATAIMTKFGEVPENFEKQLADLMAFYEAAMPSVFILGSFSFAFIIVMVNTAIARRLGNKLPRFGSFREMKLPTPTVWVYLLIVLLPFLAKLEQGSMSELVYVNASVILRVLFFVQGISLVLYYMNYKKLPKWTTVIAVIVALILSPITILLGILDTGMNFRAWISRDKSK